MNYNPDDMIKEMLVSAKIYCRAQNPRIRPSTLGRIIVNDGDFFKRITKTRNCTFTTYKKVMAWFAKNMPEGTREDN